MKINHSINYAPIDPAPLKNGDDITSLLINSKNIESIIHVSYSLMNASSELLEVDGPSIKIKDITKINQVQVKRY